MVYLPIVLKMQCETHLLTKTSFDLSIFKYLKIDAMPARADGNNIALKPYCF